MNHSLGNGKELIGGLKTNAERVLSLIRNKTKRVNLTFNPTLWELLEKVCHEEGLSATHKLEDMIINYLDEKKMI